MSTPLFGLTLDELPAAASKCDAAQGEVQGSIQSMVNYVNTLAGSYTGITAQELVAVTNQWHNDSNVLCSVLADIANGLRLNYQTYKAAEEGSYTNLANVQATLPPGRF